METIEFECFTQKHRGLKEFFSPPPRWFFPHRGGGVEAAAAEFLRGQGRGSCRCPGERQSRVSRVPQWCPPHSTGGTGPSGHGAEPLKRIEICLHSPGFGKGVGPTRGGIPALPTKVKRLGLTQIQPYWEISWHIRKRAFSLQREEALVRSPGSGLPRSPRGKQKCLQILK